MRSKAKLVIIVVFSLIAEIEAGLAQIEKLPPMSRPSIPRAGVSRGAEDEYLNSRGDTDPFINTSNFLLSSAELVASKMAALLIEIDNKSGSPESFNLETDEDVRTLQESCRKSVAAYRPILKVFSRGKLLKEDPRYEDLCGELSRPFDEFQKVCCFGVSKNWI